MLLSPSRPARPARVSATRSPGSSDCARELPRAVGAVRPVSAAMTLTAGAGRGSVAPQPPRRLPAHRTTDGRRIEGHGMQGRLDGRTAMAALAIALCRPRRRVAGLGEHRRRLPDRRGRRHRDRGDQLEPEPVRLRADRRPGRRHLHRPRGDGEPGHGKPGLPRPGMGLEQPRHGIGSSWTLIETPYLRAGHWKLLGDGGSKQSVDVFSNDFWSSRASRAPAIAGSRRSPRALQERGGRDGGVDGAACSWTLKVLDEVAPGGALRPLQRRQHGR